MTERMISYAQNAEDVVLRNAFAGQAEGFYIDVGANDPVEDSVTKHFSELGWRGINVEPVTTLHAALVADRPRDINLCVAVGEQPGVLEFGEVSSNPGLSTFNSVLDEKNATAGLPIVHRQVPIRTLADICAEHVTGEIDFLKVDVEGFEGQVLRGNDWSRFRPKVILAENNFSENWHDYVLEQGYTQTLHDGLNRFYVRNDLLDTVGRRLNRPAIHAVDGYDPWYYVRQLRAAGAAVPGAVPATFGSRVYRRLRRDVGRVVRRVVPRR